jgi:hypothetical protein
MTDLDRRHLELRVDPAEPRLRHHVPLTWIVAAVFVLSLALGYATARAADSLSGYATWYDVAPGNAAAGPALRSWLGSGWRGTTVKVCHNGCILTVLSDWCACGPRSGRPTLLDMSRSDFAVLGDPGAGVLSVTVSRAGAVALPATDTEAPSDWRLLLVAVVFAGLIRATRWSR